MQERALTSLTGHDDDELSGFLPRHQATELVMFSRSTLSIFASLAPGLVDDVAPMAALMSQPTTSAAYRTMC